jgi:endonuclease/exonuclease/phosphatase family metal-dependent hydrolase
MAPLIDDERINSILSNLKEIDADIICLQECSPEFASLIAQKLGLQFQSDANCTAVLTRLEIITSSHIELQGSTASTMTLLTPKGTNLLVVSAHFAWGGDKEGLRLSQARLIEDSIDKMQLPNSLVTILTGDLNCVPQSATIRYLTGLDPLADNSSTLWVDAWALRGKGDGSTVSPSNPKAAETARSVGISQPAMLPNRRIDYILLRGWIYGKAGCPVTAKVYGLDFDKNWPSDHYAISAECWDPEIDQN